MRIERFLFDEEAPIIVGAGAVIETHTSEALEDEEVEAMTPEEVTATLAQASAAEEAMFLGLRQLVEAQEAREQAAAAHDAEREAHSAQRQTEIVATLKILAESIAALGEKMYSTYSAEAQARSGEQLELVKEIVELGGKLVSAQNTNTVILRKGQEQVATRLEELTARKPTGAQRNPKTGEWRFRYGKN